MKDPTIPEANSRKKIMFYDSPDRQTRLRIRCEFDGISQSQFFRMMVGGYINNDELVLEFLSKCKQDYSLQGQHKRNKITQTHKEAKKTAAAFSLGDDEVESIFDIIETETGL
jgi:hypothetical protein